MNELILPLSLLVVFGIVFCKRFRRSSLFYAIESGVGFFRHIIFGPDSSYSEEPEDYAFLYLFAVNFRIGLPDFPRRDG